LTGVDGQLRDAGTTGDKPARNNGAGCSTRVLLGLPARPGARHRDRMPPPLNQDAKSRVSPAGRTVG